jgi:hypothetical protein
VRVVEPLAGTEFAPGDAGKRFVHGFSRSARALLLCEIFVLAGRCLHVTARCATFAKERNSYDFDPTTSPKKSGKTPVKQEDDARR